MLVLTTAVCPVVLLGRRHWLENRLPRESQQGHHAACGQTSHVLIGAVQCVVIVERQIGPTEYK